jgi:hypothetical protein
MMAVMVVNLLGVMIHILALVVVVLVDREQISLIFKLVVMVVPEDIMETFLEPASVKVVGLLVAAVVAHGALPLAVVAMAVLVAVEMEILQQETVLALALEVLAIPQLVNLVQQILVVVAVALVKLVEKLLAAVMVVQVLFLLDIH